MPKDRYHLYVLPAAADRGGQAAIASTTAAPSVPAPATTRLELWANADSGAWQMHGAYGWLALAYQLGTLAESDMVSGLRVVDTVTGSAIEFACGHDG